MTEILIFMIGIGVGVLACVLWFWFERRWVEVIWRDNEAGARMREILFGKK